MINIKEILEIFNKVKKFNLKLYEIAILHYENNRLILEVCIDRITKFYKYPLEQRQFYLYNEGTENLFKDIEYDGLAVAANGEMAFVIKNDDETFNYADIDLRESEEEKNGK